MLVTRRDWYVRIIPANADDFATIRTNGCRHISFYFCPPDNFSDSEMKIDICRIDMYSIEIKSAMVQSTKGGVFLPTGNLSG
jgi:hypothetical protein